MGEWLTGSALLRRSLLCGPAVFWAVPEPAVAWLPDAPKTPALAPVAAPWRFPRPSKSLSTRGSVQLISMFPKIPGTDSGALETCSRIRISWVDLTYQPCWPGLNCVALHSSSARSHLLFLCGSLRYCL
jgi:hypothetical protein